MANVFVAAFEILSFGAIIVLIVLGLGIIASMMGIFNFAQGEFVLLGAYITYLAYAKGLPIWAGMVAAPFIVGALGSSDASTQPPSSLCSGPMRSA